MTQGHLEPSTAHPQIPQRDEYAAARGAKLLRAQDICSRLGISRHTWTRWVKSRRAPAPVPGLPGYPRWAVRDIDAFERGRFGSR